MDGAAPHTGTIVPGSQPGGSDDAEADAGSVMKKAAVPLSPPPSSRGVGTRFSDATPGPLMRLSNAAMRRSTLKRLRATSRGIQRSSGAGFGRDDGELCVRPMGRGGGRATDLRGCHVSQASGGLSRPHPLLKAGRRLSMNHQLRETDQVDAISLCVNVRGRAPTELRYILDRNTPTGEPCVRIPGIHMENAAENVQWNAWT